MNRTEVIEMLTVEDCPQHLKMARTKIFVVLAAGLICLALIVYFGYLPTASTTEISVLDPRFGAVDPRYGQVDEEHGLNWWLYFNYDKACYLVKLATYASFITALVWPLSKEKKKSTRRIVFELIALASLPVLVHVMGYHLIQNFGGIGCE